MTLLVWELVFPKRNFLRETIRHSDSKTSELSTVEKDRSFLRVYTV